jgi:hypothetical protein
VQIIGSSDVPGFASAEVSIAIANDPTGTWYPLATNEQPVTNGTLASLDTTIISDGEYDLRLRVTLVDGNFRDAIVSGLRVRNSTPIETPTSPMVAPVTSPLPTELPTQTRFATPTALPHNPAKLGPGDVSASLLYGGMAAFVIFVIVSLYLWLRRKLS